MQKYVGQTHRGALARRPHRISKNAKSPGRPRRLGDQPEIPPQLVIAVEESAKARMADMFKDVFRLIERVKGFAVRPKDNSNVIQLNPTGKGGAVCISVTTHRREYRIICHLHPRASIGRAMKHAATHLATQFPGDIRYLEPAAA